ncbi:hypothetical protein BAUCODRAFT_80280 [Baudoinia panamericana UAMH 10762]|uniref:Small ribosomal subunit protein mS41 n=1 Tax=Baudoinia panamericana (strain UAMH 10762) TaxID=717646 RepID=M2MXU1_BAUPA|nr:uncharacterized protein BAUCODRAFT_80280 [Baudoinia panamericana UAMH 10762]EMC91070.1 hypothetical protein BAUCODRAFT_80280 [Baudoinia panamericana UAMH 10762]
MAPKTSPSILTLPSSLRTSLIALHHRPLHRLARPTLSIPKPTPFVPDVPTFLTLIGRNLSAHAAKIPSWEALFTLTSDQLRESGVEPPRARRYLLWWRDRFRNGITGIGGDLKEVKDGIAELRVVEVPSERKVDREATLSRSAGMRKVVVNVRPTEKGALVVPEKAEMRNVQPVAGVRLVQGGIIGGTGVEQVKGYEGVARLKVKEGLWEERRGHKVDGGERRKAEVRYKRRIAERKNAR